MGCIIQVKNRKGPDRYVLLVRYYPFIWNRLLTRCMFLKLFSRAKPPQDLELIQQYRETGDVELVGQLFERYTEMVYLICLKYLKDEDESKDATMHIFEQLLTGLHKHEITNFKSWLHVLTKNYCLMLLRSQKKRSADLIDEKTLPLVEKAALAHATDPADHEPELQLLTKGLDALSQEQRTCVELFYLQKKSYKEVAELTGYEIGQVKSHIQNGKRNLKNYINKNYEQE